MTLTIILIYLLGMAVSLFISWKSDTLTIPCFVLSWMGVLMQLMMLFVFWLDDLKYELRRKKQEKLREQEKLKRQPKAWTKGTIYFNQK